MVSPVLSRKLPFDALVFDLGNVLVHHDNALLFRRLAAHCSASDALSRIHDAMHDPRYGTGERPIAAMHEMLCGELGYSRGWGDFKRDWSSHFTIDPTMIALLRDLASLNRVMIFSNTNREHWDYLTEAMNGALRDIETYLSFEIGKVKPDPEAFRLVARQADIEPTRSLFIDDLAENVAGAEAVGFRGHVFTTQAAFERFLATCV